MLYWSVPYQHCYRYSQSPFFLWSKNLSFLGLSVVSVCPRFWIVHSVHLSLVSGCCHFLNVFNFSLFVVLECLLSQYVSGLSLSLTDTVCLLVIFHSYIVSLAWRQLEILSTLHQQESDHDRHSCSGINDTCTYACTHTRTHTGTRTHARTHAHSSAHTRTHTHSIKVAAVAMRALKRVLIQFPPVPLMTQQLAGIVMIWCG